MQYAEAAPAVVAGAIPMQQDIAPWLQELAEMAAAGDLDLEEMGLQLGASPASGAQPEAAPGAQPAAASAKGLTVTNPLFYQLPNGTKPALDYMKKELEPQVFMAWPLLEPLFPNLFRSRKLAATGARTQTFCANSIVECENFMVKNIDLVGLHLPASLHLLVPALYNADTRNSRAAMHNVQTVFAPGRSHSSALKAHVLHAAALAACDGSTIVSGFMPLASIINSAKKLGLTEEAARALRSQSMAWICQVLGSRPDGHIRIGSVLRDAFGCDMDPEPTHSSIFQAIDELSDDQLVKLPDAVAAATGPVAVAAGPPHPPALPHQPESVWGTSRGRSNQLTSVAGHGLHDGTGRGAPLQRDSVQLPPLRFAALSSGGGRGRGRRGGGGGGRGAGRALQIQQRTASPPAVHPPQQVQQIPLAQRQQMLQQLLPPLPQRTVQGQQPVLQLASVPPHPTLPPPAQQIQQISLAQQQQRQRMLQELPSLHQRIMQGQQPPLQLPPQPALPPPAQPQTVAAPTPLNFLDLSRPHLGHALLPPPLAAPLHLDRSSGTTVVEEEGRSASLCAPKRPPGPVSSPNTSRQKN